MGWEICVKLGNEKHETCIFGWLQCVKTCHCVVLWGSQRETTCRVFAIFEIKLYHASDFFEMFLRYQLSAAANFTQIMAFGLFSLLSWNVYICAQFIPVPYLNFRMVVWQNVAGDKILTKQHVRPMSNRHQPTSHESRESHKSHP